MRTFAQFGAKIRIFRNLWCVPHGQRGERQFFEILFGRLLWTAT